MKGLIIAKLTRRGNYELVNTLDKLIGTLDNISVQNEYVSVKDYLSQFK